ncbi:hypothetical protein D3C87_1730270 [compost metagenome]
MDDDVVSFGNAQRAHGLGEGFRRRQHMWVGAGVVGDGFQVEEDRARQALGLEVRAGVSSVQPPTGVDDPQIGRVEAIRQGLGRDQGTV